MAIQVVCTNPGMRRCGMVHPVQAVHPDGTFSAAQLKVLRADPSFTVVEVPDSALPKGQKAAAEAQETDAGEATGKKKGK